MSSMEAFGRQPALTRAIDCLSDPRRRRVLAALREEATSVTDRELAGTVAAGDWPSTGTDAPDDAGEIRTRLRHVHLPRLAAADLVTWNEAGNRVSLTDHPFNESDGFGGLLDADERLWEAAATVYGDERRRIAFDAVDSLDDPAQRAEIARVVADHVTEHTGSSVPVEEIAVQLHHRHLPALDRAGLIDYDADEGSAVRTDDVELPRFDGDSLASAASGR